jgi:hypothetical protein
VKIELISENGCELVLGKIDKDPIVTIDICRGIEVAVSYDKIREHRKAV